MLHLRLAMLTAAIPAAALCGPAPTAPGTTAPGTTAPVLVELEGRDRVIVVTATDDGPAYALRRDDVFETKPMTLEALRTHDARLAERLDTAIADLDWAAR